MSFASNHRLPSFFAGFVCLLILGSWILVPRVPSIATAAAADQPLINLTNALAAGAEEKLTYNGSTNCQRCHREPVDEDRESGRIYYVRMNESSTWLLHDRHSKAFKLLQCTRGQAMSAKLGYDVTKDQRCLSCHADWQTDRAAPPDALMLSEGVACEACHGPSSKYYADHSIAQKWHPISLADRAAHYGMTNLRDPQVRAEVCLSCHVGNAEQGKVVTHDMYAAGHPPLPSFELRDFCEMMPRHWNDLQAELRKLQNDHHPNEPEVRKYLGQIERQLGQDDATMPGLKAMLVGAVSALSQSAKLVSDQAVGNVHHVGDAKNSDHAAVWPEFALYDCSMCHHELRYPGWRQQRTTLAPGRPLIPRWPQALVSVAIDQMAGADPRAAADKKKQFAKLLNDLDEPFRRQPFAEPGDIAAPAKKLNDFLNRELLDPLKAAKCDSPASLAALQQLCAAAAEKTPDYDSARQLAWAFHSVYEEYKALKATGGKSSNAAWEAADRELEALNKELRLTMNPLRAAGRDVCEEALTDADLQAAIDSAAAYSPAQFQQHFKALTEAVSRLD
jgi:hypothetical protein